MADNTLVNYEVTDGVAVITVNNPPVNALSPGVPEGISDGIDKAVADENVQAIVLIGGGRTFIAGADIKEFGNSPLHEIHNLDPDLRFLAAHFSTNRTIVVARVRLGEGCLHRYQPTQTCRKAIELQPSVRVPSS